MVIALGYETDTFTVSRQDAVDAVLIAIRLIAAGTVAIGFSLYRKRRAV